MPGVVDPGDSHELDSQRLETLLSVLSILRDAGLKDSEETLMREIQEKHPDWFGGVAAEDDEEEDDDEQQHAAPERYAFAPHA